MSKHADLLKNGKVVKWNWQILLAGTLLLISVVFFAQRTLFSSPAINAGGGIKTVTVGKLGGDFTLTQVDKPVSLSDFQGKVVLMYFGFAPCPDVCPTTLGLLGASLKVLSEKELAQIQPIFISIDPERDNGQVLMDYASYFHPKFIGLTGTPDELKQVAKQYNTLFFKEKLDSSAMDYTMNHTSKAYVISKDGKSMQILPHSMTRPELVASIRAAL